jgi:hypothetical protein
MKAFLFLYPPTENLPTICGVVRSCFVELIIFNFLVFYDAAPLVEHHKLIILVFCMILDAIGILMD